MFSIFFHSDSVMLINFIKITSIVHFLPVNSQVFGGSFFFGIAPYT